MLSVTQITALFVASSTSSFKPMSRIGGGNNTEKFKAFSLRTVKAREEFQERLQSRLRDPNYLENPIPDILWSYLKSAVMQNSEETWVCFK